MKVLGAKMSDKYKPESDIDSVPVSNVRIENQSTSQLTSQETSEVNTVYVLEHYVSRVPDSEKQSKDD